MFFLKVPAFVGTERTLTGDFIVKLVENALGWRSTRWMMDEISATPLHSNVSYETDAHKI